MKTHIDILPREVTNDKFSVFGCGYRNKDGVAVLAAKPNQSQDIAYIGNYIRSDRAQWATNTLRSMLTTATKDELGDFKKLYFETATFNGIFSYRSARNLVTLFNRILAFYNLRLIFARVAFHKEIDIQFRTFTNCNLVAGSVKLSILFILA